MPEYPTQRIHLFSFSLIRVTFVGCTQGNDWEPMRLGLLLHQRISDTKVLWSVLWFWTDQELNARGSRGFHVINAMVPLGTRFQACNSKRPGGLFSSSPAGSRLGSLDPAADRAENRVQDHGRAALGRQRSAEGQPRWAVSETRIDACQPQTNLPATAFSEVSASEQGLHKPWLYIRVGMVLYPSPGHHI